MDQARERVSQVFSDIMEVDAGELTDKLSPDEIDAWDSVRHLNLMLALEEEFGLTIDEDAASHLLSFGKIVEFIERQK